MHHDGRPCRDACREGNTLIANQRPYNILHGSVAKLVRRAGQPKRAQNDAETCLQLRPADLCAAPPSQSRRAVLEGAATKLNLEEEVVPFVLQWGYNSAECGCAMPLCCVRMKDNCHGYRQWVTERAGCLRGWLHTQVMQMHGTQHSTCSVQESAACTTCREHQKAQHSVHGAPQ